jgi:hypothetical protein
LERIDKRCPVRTRLEQKKTKATKSESRAHHGGVARRGKESSGSSRQPRRAGAFARGADS